MNSRVRDERGVTMVLFALMITALFGMVAIVIDLAAARNDRRENKSIADQSAAAGTSELDLSAWAAACKAYNYLVSNQPALRSGATLSFEKGDGTAVASPCGVGQPVCDPSTPATWARIQAVSADGRFTADIRAGYVLPDPAFEEDQSRIVSDSGTSPCEHIAVILREREDGRFSSVLGNDPVTTQMRSVARLTTGDQRGQSAALILFERHDCNVLQTGGSNTRVVALAYQDSVAGLYAPGVIQFDTAADGSCNSGNPVINGQSTGTGPSILACSLISVYTDPSACGPNAAVPPPANMQSRIGVYAKQFASVPPNYISRPYGNKTYGDTDHQKSVQATRLNVDKRYRVQMQGLDQRARGALCLSGANCSTVRSLPKDCGALTAQSTCTTASGDEWRVITGTGAEPSCANVPAMIPETRVFFECPNLSVGNVLLENATDIVVTGKLSVTGGAFKAPKAERTYILGTESGAGRGLEVASSGSLELNKAGWSSCTSRTKNDPTALGQLVLGRGVLDVRGGMTLCSTTVLLSSNFGKIPNSDGTAPCPSSDNATACGSYSGTVNLVAGARIDWTAPNREPNRPACPAAPTCYDPTTAGNEFEDLALWVEAATNNNSINGGATTSMAGVFVLPNADAFNLAGGGSLPITLNAQFVSRKLKVSGGATVALNPSPNDSVPSPLFETVLIR